ncbi:MAG: 3'-5' exonuclease, partial [Myxococcales bacterium]
EVARARKRPVWEVLKEEERAREFVQLLEKYGARLAQRGFSEAARALVEEVRLFDEARRGAQGLPAQARRIEAMESLLRQLIEYEKREEQRAAQAGEGSDEPFAAGLPGYLARLALDSKEDDGDAGDAVTLMTLHGAKGLEWRCVFLCGLEEGLLPHSGRGSDETVEGGNLEEERRLCYVGMTRARERLVLTRAVERIRRGKAIPRTPSRFLEDLPPELLDVVDLAGPQAESARDVQQQKAKSFFAAMGDLLGEDEPEAV